MRGFKKEAAERVAGDWTLSHDGLFVCPCGRRVEDDGQCPDGHTSPMRQLGLI